MSAPRQNTMVLGGVMGGVLCSVLLGGCMGEIDPPPRDDGQPAGASGGGGAAGSPKGPAGPSSPTVPVNPSPVSSGPFVGGPAPLRRLNQFEYNNAVRDLFGLTSRPADGWVTEAHGSGFDNDSAGQIPNQAQVEEFIGTAGQIAGEVAARLPQLFPCDDKQKGAEVCADEFVDRFFYRGFRRPVTAMEKQRAKKAFALGAADEGYAGGVKAMVEYLLLSPQFWYRFERGLPGASGAVAPLTDWEVASRLSFFVQGTLPDDDLLMAASAGRLKTPGEVGAQVTRLLESPKAAQSIKDFHRQWLQIDRLESLDKPKTTTWDAEVNTLLVNGVYASIEDLFKQDRADLSTLFTGTSAFVNERTAAYFGIVGVKGKELRRMEVMEPRAGLITNAAFMAGLSHKDQTNPIARGNWIRDRFLCQPAPPAPPDLNAMFPTPAANLGIRELLMQHRAIPSCAGCHDLIDPIGFALENYDSLGRYRAQVNGKPVDAAGEIKGTRNADGRFTSAVEMAKHLGSNKDTHACVANQWFNFAFGRAPETIDQRFLDDLGAKFSQERDVKKLITAIATSDLFRSRPTPSAVKGGCAP